MKLACAALLTCTLTTTATFAGKCTSKEAASKTTVATAATDNKQAY